MLVWASDWIARSNRRHLEVLDELNRLNVEFVSFCKQIDIGGSLGRPIAVIMGAIAEPEGQFDHRQNALWRAARPP